MKHIHIVLDHYRQRLSKLEKRGKLSAVTKSFSIDKIALLYVLITRAALDIVFFKSSSNRIKKDFIYLFIEIMLPLEKSEDVFCTLSDRFEIWSNRYGVRTAKRMLKWHAVWIVLGHHGARARKLLFAAAALFGAKKLGEWMGRFF